VGLPGNHNPHGRSPRIVSRIVPLGPENDARQRPFVYLLSDHKEFFGKHPRPLLIPIPRNRATTRNRHNHTERDTHKETHTKRSAPPQWKESIPRPSKRELLPCLKIVMCFCHGKVVANQLPFSQNIGWERINQPTNQPTNQSINQ